MHRSSRFVLLSREKLRHRWHPNSSFNLILKSATSTTPHADQQAKLARIVDSKSNDEFNNQQNSYVNEIYQAWREDPTQVHKYWDVHFRNVSIPASSKTDKDSSTSTSSSINELIGLIQALNNQNQASLSTLEPTTSVGKLIEDHLNLHSLIRAYQVRGHKEGNLDPLGIRKFAEILLLYFYTFFKLFYFFL